MLSDNLDTYLLKNERDDAVKIIRKCQRILAEYRANASEQELAGRLLKVLNGPEAAAITRRNDAFLSRVS